MPEGLFGLRGFGLYASLRPFLEEQLSDLLTIDAAPKQPTVVDDRPECKNRCGRPVARGRTKSGKRWDTCCRACAVSDGATHDESCCIRGCRPVCPEGARCRQRLDAEHLELESHPLDADYDASCAARGQEPEPRSLKMVFDWADVDRSGKLTRNELTNVLEVMARIKGERFPPITNAVWKKMDEDGNGVVNFNEFTSWAGPRLGLPLGLRLLAQRTSCGTRGGSLNTTGSWSLGRARSGAPCGVVGCPCEAFVMDDRALGSTLRKCPNCEYSVTWHSTHCCASCKSRPGKHGPKCEKRKSCDGHYHRCQTCKHKQETHVAIARSGEVDYPMYWEHHSRRFQEFIQMPSTGQFQHLLDATYKRTWTRDRRKHNPNNPSVPRGYQVERVSRNENSYVWREFFARRTELMTRISEGSDLWIVDDVKTAAPLRDSPLADRLQQQCNEWYLFHGTTTAAAHSICASDFKISCAGGNTGTLYGRGLYFAESITKADEYATPNEDGICAVLLCRVLGGNVLYTDESFPDPDELVAMCVEGPFDCVLGDREKTRKTFREFVIFDSEDCYPEYIIEYRRLY